MFADNSLPSEINIKFFISSEGGGVDGPLNLFVSPHLVHFLVRIFRPVRLWEQTWTQSASNRENLDGLRRECADASQNGPMVL